MKLQLNDIRNRIFNGGTITEDEALELASLSGCDLFDLFSSANCVREHFAGERAHLCSIINAKSGLCPEDCAFCAQSIRNDSLTPVYPLKSPEAIVEVALEAERNGSSCFGIVTSGTSLQSGEELELICLALRMIRKQSAVSPACSLGIIDRGTAVKLKEAGAGAYHHNLETSRSFFPRICSTHDYDEDVATVREAKGAGLRVCCGGIFGMGESMAQRIELAFTLRQLDVDSVPMNFLNPIPGTPLAGADYLTPMECLHTIALFRMILPAKRIIICGGRERNLRELQSWIFFAGASGVMIGAYLTTSGRDEALDHILLKDLGLEIASSRT